MTAVEPKICWLGTVPYEPTWRKMQAFADSATPETGDELWLLEHPPVFTLGLNGSPEHVLAPGEIPLVQVDRGGQVTYHGPGQLVVYPLIRLERLGLGVRDLVSALENAVIGMLAEMGIDAVARADAPGVYVGGRKIGSIGLRVRNGVSYHGLAVNVGMSLEPFQRINPCGYADLEVTQLRDLDFDTDPKSVSERLLRHLLPLLGYNSPSFPTIEDMVTHEQAHR